MKTIVAVCLMMASVVSAEVKNNWMYFESNVTVTARFEATYHAVGKGEKWEGVSHKENGVNVRCGDRRSAEVAAEFIDGLAVVNALATQHEVEPLPHELEFAVFGNLTITMRGRTAVCTNFRMGKGRYADYHNWWLASSKCEATPTTHRMTCICQGMNLQFHSENKSDKIVVLPTPGSW
eukprot:TRINITY_DN1658_c0_g2_i3.p1 TRINITY_DN1658_c0_g2~~TRINITY_DN1658_c0_g2_i3.p1  ORF type:complete len:179 (+),score=34.24 TRINITY_DN1658_c0_g2_i3:64-600(+)